MRVALLAPLVSPIREPNLGGVATLLTDLAAGLQDAGVDVDLFAASGSQVDGLSIVDTGIEPAAVSATLFHPLEAVSGATWERRVATAYPAFEAAYAAIRSACSRRSGGYDIVHNHAFDAPAIELAQDLGCPVLHTLHLPPDPIVSEALRAARAGPHPPVVAAVSPSQRAQWERHTQVDALLPAGVPTARIPWSDRSGPDLLVASRISPEKGVLEAIEIAGAAGRRLLIAGTPYDAAYTARVERAAASARGVEILGPLPRPELWRVMTRCAALLFPILWEEPFGLVSAEAQAAGCPVVGFRAGALGDVVADGVTGAVLERGDVEGACRAIEGIERFDRWACRRHAETSLDVAPMLQAHLDLYERLTAR